MYIVQRSFEGDELSFLYCSLLIILDSILYGLMALIVTKVILLMIMVIVTKAIPSHDHDHPPFYTCFD